jgi:cytochrome c peroxidase
MEENRPGRLSLIYAIFGTLLGVLLVGIVAIMFMQLFQTRMTNVQAQDATAVASVEKSSEAAATEEKSTNRQSAEVVSEAAAQETESAATAAESTANAETASPVVQDSSSEDAISAFNKAGCGGCHTIAGVPGANGQVGPNLSNIGVDGATRIDGYSAEEYVTESILDPNAFIAPECPSGDCPAGVMLQSFAQTLSEDDLSAIVSYLSALGTEAAPASETAVAAPAALDASMPPEAVLNPFMPLPGDAPDAAKAALGKYLFFDQRLSNNNSRSCATCHQPDLAFTDGEALNEGYPSVKYFRNAPTVLNTIFADYRYWDGRMDGSDLPTLVRDHITEAHFMSNDGRLMVERMRQAPEYDALFQEAFGGEPSFGKVLNAISAYVSILNSPPVAYDQALEGDTSGFSEDELAGYELFTGKAGCIACHAGPYMSDDKFYNTGVGTDTAELFSDPERQLTFRRFFRIHGTPDYRNLTEDVGRYAMTLDEADWAAFRTPTLREVGRTAPYMHDGSLATLEDVVNFYNAGGGEGQTAGLEPLDLSEEEVAQLVAFLESLSSDLPAIEAPALPAYGVLPLGDSEAPAEVSATVEMTATTESTAPAVEEAPAGPSEEALAAISKGGCIACHTIPDVPGAVGVVGPDMSDIGAVAAEAEGGMSAEEFIYESIVDPNAIIAEECPTGPCPAGVMTPNMADILSPDEIDAIVGYLVTLKGGE